MQKEKQLVPKLRFPEFEDSWWKSTFGNVIEYTKGYAFKSNTYTVKGVRIVRVSDLGANSIKKNNEKLYISKQNSEGLEKYLLKKNDIIVTTVGSNPKLIESAVGRGIYVNSENEGILNQNLLKIEQNSHINSKFLFSHLNSSRYRYYIKGIKRGNANQANITVKELLEYKISLTSIEEQQKIANFLSAIDKRIQNLEKKKELLEQYKKGITQKIFKQEIRFKDDNGKAFPEWEHTRLGEHIYKTGKKNKENIQYPIYSINNQEGFRPQSEQFEGLDSNERGYDISLYKIIKEKTFAYNPARINVGSIGYSDNLSDIIISSLYVCFKAKKKLEDAYLLTYLDTFQFKKDVLRFSEGGVRQYLFFENISKIKIPIPSNNEQKKIAAFFVAIDKKIELTAQQLEHTKTYKKGLLQQMFV